MSLYDYEESKRIAAQDFCFYALIMAAMRQADSNNLEALCRAFPQVYSELRERYNTRGGRLPEDGQTNIVRQLEETDRITP